MKLLKITLLMAAFTVAVTFTCKAQDYAKVEYWGKVIPLDQSFFQYLNANFSTYVQGDATRRKYNDFKDYNEIYIAMVDNLKAPTFTIIVTEANQLQFRNARTVFPGTVNEPNRSKKSGYRAAWLLYEVVLPSLQQFVANYNKIHQFQY